MTAAGRPVGMLTRGTTAPNRLRRVDRWLTGPCAGVLRQADDPVVVDLGFGATPATTLELADRLRAVRADVEVVGLEIDPVRVAAARARRRPGVDFRLGGFELPLDGRRPVLVRAMNVLRQYDPTTAADAWRLLCAGLQPLGQVVEGTCDEVGRRAAWVTLGADGPRSLTLSAHLASLDHPGRLAARLPKALIHGNVPGAPVHAWLTALDAAWERAAPYAAFGVRQRWMRTVAGVRETGWPVVGGAERWRLGEVTVAWEAVAAPADGRTVAP